MNTEGITTSEVSPEAFKVGGEDVKFRIVMMGRIHPHAESRMSRKNIPVAYMVIRPFHSLSPTMTAVAPEDWAARTLSIKEHLPRWAMTIHGTDGEEWGGVAGRHKWGFPTMVPSVGWTSFSAGISLPHIVRCGSSDNLGPKEANRCYIEG